MYERFVEQAVSLLGQDAFRGHVRLIRLDVPPNHGVPAQPAQLQADILRFTPCLPPAWQAFEINYRYRETFYHITVRNAGRGKSVNRVVLNGAEQPDKTLHLVDDRNEHDIEVDVD